MVSFHNAVASMAIGFSGHTYMNVRLLQMSNYWSKRAGRTLFNFKHMS